VDDVTFPVGIALSDAVYAVLFERERAEAG
jgi:hypothetical protein